MSFGNFGPVEPAQPVEDAPATFGAKQRTRSQIAKGASAKGAQGERDVLAAFRDVMRNVEDELTHDGHKIVARSGFATRKRLEKGTSNRDLGNIPLIAIEVKRNEKLAVSAMFAQALKQTDAGELPVLVYRRNREPWTVKTWVALYDMRGRIVRYVEGEVSLPEFLSYYATVYRSFLVEGLSSEDAV